MLIQTSSRCSAVATVVAVALLAACGNDNASSSNRVVSVSKQINEFIYDIGAEKNLVGRDLTSIYPAQITRLPSVGYHRALSAEGVISLRPTLFLTDGNVGPDAVLEQLRKVGIPVTVLAPGTTLDSAHALMTRLGVLFRREHAADSVNGAWRSAMDSILADTAQWAGNAHPRVLVMHMGQIVNNYLGVGAGGPADAILRWSGATNAIDSTRPMTRLNPELIARLAPDVIIATDAGFDRLGSAAKFAAMPGVNLTPAGKNQRIYRINETEILYFGPRTPHTIREVRIMIHPAASPH